jgi:hypothetical protein
MTQRFKLVVLDANFYWTEQLFSACSEFADILLLRPMDFRAFRQHYGSYFIDLKPKLVSEGVWEQRICCPPGWLFHYWSLTERLFVSIIRQFQDNHPLFFAFNYPYYHGLAKRLDAYSIYYSIDDYSHYWAGREAQTEQVEKLAIAQASLTICVSNYRANYFKQAFPSQADRIFHLPHGCTSAFMVNQALAEPKNLPPELQAYSRPVAGYIGALSDRFDFYYFAKVAAQLPDLTFILGGNLPRPEDGSPEWWQGVELVRNLPNVHFIDRVAHDRLGEYLQSFDVLLMPYSQCNFNLNACPTKLWDYMGTSLPVVANNVVPEVNLWSDVLLIAEDPDDFADKVKFALANRSWKSVERLAIAQSHTWRMQAEKLHKLLAISWVN